MEILPPKSAPPDRKGQDGTTSAKLPISSIEALKLVPNQSYDAKVIARYFPQEASAATGQTSQTPADSSTQPKPIPSEKLLAEQVAQRAQWLLQIKQQLVRIETSIPLKVGEHLAIHTQASGDVGEISLKLAPPTQNTQADSDIAPLIMRALSQSLPRQTLLQASLNQLLSALLTSKPQQGEANAPPPSSSPSAERAMPIAPTASPSKTIQNSWLRQVQSILPQISELLVNRQSTNDQSATNQATPYQLNEKAGQSLKTWLEQSGSLFESKLAKSPVVKQWLNFQIALQNAQREITQTIQALQQATDSKVQTNRPASPFVTSSDDPNRQKVLEAPIRTLQALTQLSTQIDRTIAQLHGPSGALDPKETRQMLQTLNTNLKQPSLVHAGINESLASLDKHLQSLLPTQPNAQSIPPTTDLKSTLITLLATLNEAATKTATAKEATTETPQPALSAKLSPFQFPAWQTLLDHQAIQKANTVLADQELSTGQLLKLMASILNRIQFTQLNSLFHNQQAGPDNTNAQSWFFELPVLQNTDQTQVVQLRIDREQSEGKREQEQTEQTIQWRIALSFCFEELGTIFIQANLNPPTISTHIWSDKKDTLALIELEKKQFSKRLEDIGLQVEDIHCHHGQPQSEKTSIQSNLVDTRA